MGNSLLPQALFLIQMVGVRIYFFQNGIDNPYLELESSSNGRLHRRYIEFGEIQKNRVFGEFDQFGLSKTATVPWF
ncbi:CRISPR-associated protein, Csy4 family [hydrothermal vent metagenome]|uniref:CRISPR-associated protein, Csy4 family n=1 Tax=hydrothermal vent metagenome TaxID=652676 RepID=A0A3B1B6U7_9ZZZZ